MQSTCGTQLLLQSTTQNLPVQVNAVWQQMVLLLQSTARNLRMHLNATRQRSRCLCIAGTAMEPPALLQSMQPQPHYPKLLPPLLLQNIPHSRTTATATAAATATALLLLRGQNTTATEEEHIVTATAIALLPLLLLLLALLQSMHNKQKL
jgi:hypothetical protein